MVNILLVEDDDVAAEAVIRSMRKQHIANRIVVAEDGLAALDILRDTNGRHLISRPYMILLDLNMPRMNGFEFLEALRADPLLRDSVVFVLTTSNTDEDRTRAYKENIAGYMVKSEVGPQFRKLTDLLGSYWAAICLPT